MAARRIPEGTAERLARLHGVDGIAAARTTDIYPEKAAYADNAPWPAAALQAAGRPTLDLQFTSGDLRGVRGDTVAVSHVFAETGTCVSATRSPPASPTSPATRCASGAIYTRAAGLGDVVLADAPAPHIGDLRRRFAHRARPLREDAQRHRGADPRRIPHPVHGIGQEQSWGVWMIIGLAALFAALALINTARMATSERRAELATIRLLGGTRGQRLRTAILETIPTTLVALLAGAAVVAISVHGVPARPHRHPARHPSDDPRRDRGRSPRPRPPHGPRHRNLRGAPKGAQGPTP